LAPRRPAILAGLRENNGRLKRLSDGALPLAAARDSERLSET
jgi:hypothetical protein